MGVVRTICGRLAVLGHEVAPDEQVEELVGPPELHVAVEGHGVVTLQQRIEKLVLVDRALLVEPLAEVLALEHARDRRLGHELDRIDHCHLVEPLAVSAELDLRRVEHLEGLREVGLRGEVDGLAGEARAALVHARRVAHHRGEVADEEDRGVPQVLERAHLLERHAVADVEIGAGGVEARLHAQRSARGAGLREALLELRAHVQVDDAALEQRELLGHREKRAHRSTCRRPRRR
jgi:hypothetical protein